MISDGFSILDLVKHAVKTIINTLTENDRLSIVTFNTHSKVELTLTNMTEENKKKAVENFDTIRPGNRTNIWAGLQDGMEQLRTKELNNNSNRRNFLFLLTDGQPVERPPNGEEIALKE